MSKYQKNGCLTCENFPYLEATGMCAACTFGSAEAQVEMLNGEMEGTVWEREKANGASGLKLNDRDEAIKVLTKMGTDFKQCNDGFQINIKTHAGVVLYWPTTHKVRYDNMTRQLACINCGHSNDIVSVIRKLGFDKK